MRTAEKKSEVRSQKSEEPLTLALSPEYRGEGIRGIAFLLVLLILAGGLGCQNAKETQNLREGYGALDLKDYDRAIALNPNDARAYNNRGYTYQLLKQYQQAIEDYDRALAINPNSNEKLPILSQT